MTMNFKQRKSKLIWSWEKSKNQNKYVLRYGGTVNPVMFLTNKSTQETI